jgi:regulatory protein
VGEVRRRLIEAGYRLELIEEVIVRLGDLGFLDDEAFARAWVESRDRARPRGERVLRRELLLKGLDRELIARILTERAAGRAGVAEDPEAVSPDETAARRLVARHARALERITDPRARRQRAYALLARNGFDPEIAARLAASLDETAEP